MKRQVFSKHSYDLQKQNILGVKIVYHLMETITNARSKEIQEKEQQIN